MNKKYSGLTERNGRFAEKICQFSVFIVSLQQIINNVTAKI